MDRLPQEIIDRIAALLSEEKLEMAAPPPTPGQDAPGRKAGILGNLVAKVRRRHDGPQPQHQGEASPGSPPQYWTRASAATISYRWQRAVEPLVYSNLVLGYAGLEKLKAALERRPERRAYLGSLTVVLALTHKHWTEHGIRDALHPLFSVLGHATRDAAVNLTLRFEAGHPDLRHRTRQGIVFDRAHSRPLGAMPCVRSLDFTPLVPATEKGRRNVLQLHLTEQAHLATTARFPNLQSVAWHYTESELQDVRDASRDAFADHLAAHLPQRRNVTKVSLTLPMGRLGTRVGSPSSVGADSYENLYAKLHAATAHVTELGYSGVVGPSLFQAPAAGHGGWLALRHLSVGMALLAPAGWFYFDSDRYAALPEPDTPLGWHHPSYRRQGGRAAADYYPPRASSPDGRVMDPVLAAWAGLLARLPALETAQLVMRRGAFDERPDPGLDAFEAPPPPPPPPWAVGYCAPGRTGAWTGGSDLDADRARVWFVTGRWTPSDVVVRQFGRAGSAAGHERGASVIHWSTIDPPVRLEA